MLIPSPRTSDLSRLRPARAKGASGCLGRYTGSTIFEKPHGTRVSRNLKREPRWGTDMQARTYLPSYGKFAQVDPVYDQTKDDPETWNLYNYVTNNPVTKTDPDGRYQMIVDGLIVTNNNMNLDQMGYGISASGPMGAGDSQNLTYVGYGPTIFVDQSGNVLSILPGGSYGVVGGMAPSADTNDMASLSPGSGAGSGGAITAGPGSGINLSNGITVDFRMMPGEFDPTKINPAKFSAAIQDTLNSLEKIIKMSTWAKLQSENGGIKSITIGINTLTAGKVYGGMWLDKAKGDFFIKMNPFLSKVYETASGNNVPLDVRMFHELGHSREEFFRAMTQEDILRMENRNVNRWENPYRIETGESLRDGYSGLTLVP